MLADMEALIADRGDSLEAAWTTFVSWNLATGDRAGAMEGYDYAAELGGIVAEAEGSAIDDDNRFYPLAASYYRLDHAGGPIWFAVEEPALDLRFSLHPVEGGAAVATWAGAEAVAAPVAGGADLPAGGYWLVGTQPFRADSSVKVRFCLGTRETATACAPAPDTGDTGDTGDTLEPGEVRGGGLCSASRGAGSGLSMALAALVLVRRRRGRRG
jgi:hypothetical protein